jgi:hypothetical protein
MLPGRGGSTERQGTSGPNLGVATWRVDWPPAAVQAAHCGYSALVEVARVHPRTHARTAQARQLVASCASLLDSRVIQPPRPSCGKPRPQTGARALRARSIARQAEERAERPRGASADPGWLNVSFSVWLGVLGHRLTPYAAARPAEGLGGEMAADAQRGRRGSIVAEQYAEGMRQPRGGGAAPDKPPTNEEVAKAVQQKVAVRSPCECPLWRTLTSSASRQPQECSSVDS